MSTSRTTDAMIQNGLPRPISVLWSALLERDSPSDRTNRLLGVLECTLQILEALLVADYLTGPRNERVDKLLAEHTRPTLGARGNLIQAVLAAIRERSEAPFCPAALVWWFDGRKQSANARRVAKLVEDRNATVHDTAKGAPQGEDPGRTAELQAEVRELLASLRWLADHPIVRVLRSEQTTRGTMRGQLELIVGKDRSAPVRSEEWPATVPLLAERVYWLDPEGMRALDVSALLGVRQGVAEPVLLVAHKLEERGPVLADPLGMAPPLEPKAYVGSSERLDRSGWIARRSPPARLDLSLPAGARVSERALERGALVAGRYELDARIGQGGMAEVWRAADRETGEDVALKIMLPHAVLDPALRERFSREAEAMRKVRHPRVLRCHHGEQIDGRPTLVLPLMRGGNLQSRIPCSNGDLVRGWARDALEGLVALHAHNLVHRDIKPSNLFLDERDRLRIGDLGVVETGSGRRLTVARERVGTSAYMSPEQHSELEATPKSDVFALALVLHELVTGSLPADRRPGQGMTNLLGEVLRAMGDPDPDRRPTAAEALARLSPSPSGAARGGRLWLMAGVAAGALGIGATVMLLGVSVGARWLWGDARPAGVQGVAALTAVESAPPPGASRVLEAAPAGSEAPTEALEAPAEVPVVSRSGIRLLRVAAGRHQQGSPLDEADRDDGGDSETLHEVAIPHDLLVAMTEVTQAQWRAVTGTAPWRDRANQLNTKGGLACRDAGVGDQLPAVCMTWLEAVGFCNRLSELDGLTPAYLIDRTDAYRVERANGYRLPTEAEWEWIARAGEQRAHVGGAAPDALCGRANLFDVAGRTIGEWRKDHARCADGAAGLAKVGSFPPDAGPLLDLTGNVREWTETWLGPYPEGPVVDPRGPTEGRSRVVRGGSWWDTAADARFAERHYALPTDHSAWIGLRVVRPADDDAR